jgi:hypothetical protein
MKATKHAKPPTWRANCWCFEPPMSKFVLHVSPGCCAKRTQGCILVRAECPYVQSLLFVLLVLKFAVGVTNGRERDEIPSLWWSGVEVLEISWRTLESLRVLERFWRRKTLPVGAPSLPFYGLREGLGVHEREKKEKEEREKIKRKGTLGLRRPSPL